MNRDESDIKDRGRVLITGAASGIGLATALKFAAEGWQVAAVDIDGEALRRNLGETDGVVLMLPVDISDREAMATAVAASVERMGGLDCVVANAGVHARNTLLTITDEELDRLLRINIVGTVNTLRCTAPQLCSAGSGSIVLTASDQAFIGKPGNFGYGLTKGAIAQLTRTAALELAPHGVRVNAVCPATVSTPMVDKIFADAHDAGGGEVDAMWQEERGLFPLGRVCRPEEVADAIFFLGTQAGFCTGSLLKIDGGLTAG